MNDATSIIVAAVLASACAPGDGTAGGRGAEGPPAPEYPAAIHADGVELTRAMIARGDSIFHGRAAGAICSSCHAPGGAGTVLVQPLTDNTWHYSDGSYPSIREVTATGVPDATTPMAPMGGAILSQQDLVAVAAYVFWISRGGGQPALQAEP
jgi:mono/diheme cytochrome c family protein